MKTTVEELAGTSPAYGSSMFGLRQKLLLGFGGLLALLLLGGALGITYTIHHRGDLDKFLTENWRSVDYGRKMVDSLDQLDQQVRDGAVSEANSRKLIEQFDQNLDAENHNITLNGEKEIAYNLTLRWTGANQLGEHDAHAYRPALESLLKPGDHTAALLTLKQQSPLVKAGATEVINLNFDNLSPFSKSVKQRADHAVLMLVLLSVAGAIVAVLFVLVISRSILQPLMLLTRSARQIEQGNLDLVVAVQSRDELGQLADAFNSMATKLREYRRTNRAKLIRTQATTQLAINSLPDVVAIIRPDGTIDMANAAAVKLFGLRTDAHISDMKLDWLNDLFRKTSTTLLPVEPRGYESAVQVLEHGSERFFLPHATPILDEDRALIGVTIVLADVTNLRRLDEMKSGMLSVVSHELKTPLTSVRMGVHLLLEERLGELTPNQTEILLAIREDSNRLHQIIENLLDMGRMESGRGLMDLKPMNLADVVRTTTDGLESAFRDRGVNLQIDLPADLPQVLVDPARIGHVFSNLLGNALKYTPPGGDVRVTASSGMGVSPMSGVQEQDQHTRDAHALGANAPVSISITDTGPGIPAEYLDRIFERFVRVPGQSGTTGAGLGLAIAKEIVELHGGQISVQSKPGHGAAFTFTLQSDSGLGVSPLQKAKTEELAVA
jgi:PAS domain S-box-containing protein